MRIQTLVESQPSAQSLFRICQTLAAECSEFLGNPTMLLRGIKPARMDVLIQSPIRTDRHSLSGRHMGTTLFNAFFEEEFDVQHIRNRCHFATNHLADARKYGEEYFAFPINGARVASNPGISDSINIVGDTVHHLLDGLSSIPAADKQKIHDLIQTMDKPGVGNIEHVYELFDSVSEETSELLMRNWWRAKDVTVRGYEINSANQVPKYTRPAEYMIFNATHTNLVHIDAIASLTGTQEDGVEGIFSALIQHIQRI